MSNIKIVVLALMIFGHSLSLASQSISKIIIQGNARIEASTVESYSGLKIGDQYSPLIEDQAVKNLYASSLFENIRMQFLTGVVTIIVEEAKLISRVEIKGNSKLNTKVLIKQLLSQTGESLSQAKVQLDVEKIKEIYKRAGRFAAIISSRLDYQENNRVKILFDIIEGPKTAIRHILFVGNNHYRSSDLKSLVMTKESRWFKFFETNDTYDPDRLEYDKELLKNFYQSVGYIDFRVISAFVELNPTKEHFTVTYSLEEGEKYCFGSVVIDNKLNDVKTDKVQKLLNIKTGQTFSIKIINQMIEKITASLASLDYPQVNVYHEVTKNTDNLLADVKFIIDKVDGIYINKINIEGNFKTEDKVIRREFRSAEGDIFNRTYLEKAEQNLRNLDYFKVLIGVSATDQADKCDVNIKVEEKSTASIGLSVGYSSSGGAIASVSFAERNFVGSGKQIDAGVQLGKKNTNYYASITEPHFLDKALSLSGTIFKNHSGRSSGFGQTEQNYTLKTIGLRSSLGYDIFEDLTHEIDYLIKKDELSAAADSSSRFISEQMGRFITSAIKQTITYDQIDSRIIPKNGYITTILQEYAGLGGNNKYLKHEIDAKYYKSFIDNKLTLKLSFTAGNIRGAGGKLVRISDRFNLGDYTLRGFASGGVGPRDKQTKEGLGGENYYTVSTELSFPVGLPEEFNVTGLVFGDVGSLWGVSLNSKSKYSAAEYHSEKSIRASIGCGVIWLTPLAPIRIDYGIPIKKKPYDDCQKFHIKIAANL